MSSILAIDPEILLIGLAMPLGVALIVGMAALLWRKKNGNGQRHVEEVQVLLSEGRQDRMSEIQRIDIKEFREVGFLQEVNRLFFHPLGLALEIVVGDDGSERLGGVWDSRDDAEGIAFQDGPDDDKANRVAAERRRHTSARVSLLGDSIQPCGKGLDGPHS